MRTLLLGLLGALACTPAPDAPAYITADRDPMLASFTAPGDTLRYTLNWGTAARATGYTVTTTVAQGAGWSGMLTNAPTTNLSMAFTPVNTAGWDSVTFNACVTSTRSGTSKTGGPTCVQWKVVRSPGPPGPVVVDSSLVIAAVILKPDAVTLAVNTSAQFCPFLRALDGKVRFVSGYEGLTDCQGHYDAMPPADRLPGYPVAMSWRPRTLEAAGIRVAVRTPRSELAHLLFAGPFA